ncbi:MAG: RluA family pseudouridine synthase [Bacillota bacterium]
MRELHLTKNEENQRLDKFLLKYMNKAPKSFIYQMLRKKRIKLNKAKAEGNEILKQDDVLQFYLSDETLSSFMEEKTLVKAERHFAILEEDDHFLAVGKPAGLLTHPETADSRDTLIDQVLYYLYEKGQYTPAKDAAFTPALCNRLDRNTSGIVLVGKTLRGVQALNELIREKKVDKFYYTVVKGHVEQAEELTGFLSKDISKNQVHIYNDADGVIDVKKVVTKYRPLAYNKEYDVSYLEIQLITGKSHQIRAHMQSIDHPVIGDRKYGDAEKNRMFLQEFALSNQFLHGGKLKFHHGIEGQLPYLSGRTITAPMPPVFQKMVDALFPAEEEME